MPMHRHVDASALLRTLNPQQRRAADVVEGPVSILAGAGTGKTRTITYRIAHQIAAGVARPDEVLAVTFTDRAAAELRERLVGLGVGPVRAATFHAAAWAQLRYFLPRATGDEVPEVLDSKLPLVGPLARRLGIEAVDLATEVEWAKARMVTPEQYADAAAHRDAPAEPELVAAAYAAYEQAKARRGAIDFEDMLLRTRELLEAEPEVAHAVRTRYRYLTVDEFQDVNPAQWALLRAWLGDSREVCVVGDDDQTIYSFTGASADYLKRFDRHFPGASVVALTENYRSTPQVLALANRVLGGATRKRLTPTLPDGPAPALTEYADDGAEVDGVVAGVRRLLDDGVPADELAICYRVNSQSEPFEEALRTAGIPFTVRGSGGFFTLDGVREALQVLASARGKPARPPAPPPVADSAPAAPERADADVIRVLRQRLRWDPAAEPAGQRARERWRNTTALVDLAREEVDAQPGLGFDDLVARLLARAAAAREAGPGAGAVTLLTLHKAKGLEFDAVFLVAVEEGLMPISHAKTDEEVAEERRLLYVGLTRARRHLAVSWAAQRARGSRMSNRRPSRFLASALPRQVQPVPKPSAAGSPKPLDLLRGEDRALAEQLRSWRAERARTDEVPAFVVFNDRTLAAVAEARPRSKRDLLAVHGLGPAKVERYGEELLAVLAAAR